ncbi:Mitotic checkpoint protein bub3 [Intoshia linei]|uniref:Mitotic checkpoint protein bub3 n=1 Tax=Intoshia linei TaxID=1819745 RepID=A0A177B1X7_9BILA|nr:Mitotic checkpoint protein bub3 [Intoshia linei]
MVLSDQTESKLELNQVGNDSLMYGPDFDDSNQSSSEPNTSKLYKCTFCLELFEFETIEDFFHHANVFHTEFKNGNYKCTYSPLTCYAWNNITEFEQNYHNHFISNHLHVDDNLGQREMIICETKNTKQSRIEYINSLKPSWYPKVDLPLLLAGSHCLKNQFFTKTWGYSFIPHEYSDNALTDVKIKSRLKRYIKCMKKFKNQDLDSDLNDSDFEKNLNLNIIPNELFQNNTNAIDIFKLIIKKRNYTTLLTKLKLISRVRRVKQSIQTLLAEEKFDLIINLISECKNIICFQLKNVKCIQDSLDEMTEMKSLIGLLAEKQICDYMKNKIIVISRMSLNSLTGDDNDGGLDIFNIMQNNDENKFREVINFVISRERMLVFSKVFRDTVIDQMWTFLFELTARFESLRMNEMDSALSVSTGSNTTEPTSIDKKSNSSDDTEFFKNFSIDQNNVFSFYDTATFVHLLKYLNLLYSFSQNLLKLLQIVKCQFQNAVSSFSKSVPQDWDNSCESEEFINRNSLDTFIQFIDNTIMYTYCFFLYIIKQIVASRKRILTTSTVNMTDFVKVYKKINKIVSFINKTNIYIETIYNSSNAEKSELSNQITYMNKLHIVYIRIHAYISSSMSFLALQYLKNFHRIRKKKLFSLIENEDWQCVESPSYVCDIIRFISSSVEQNSEVKSNNTTESGITDAEQFDCVLSTLQKHKNFRLFRSCTFLTKSCADMCLISKNIPVLLEDAPTYISDLYKLYLDKTKCLYFDEITSKMHEFKTLYKFGSIFNSLLFLSMISTCLFQFWKTNCKNYLTVSNLFCCINEDYEKTMDKCSKMMKTLLKNYIMSLLVNYSPKAPSPSPEFRLICHCLEELNTNVRPILINLAYPKYIDISQLFHNTFLNRLLHTINQNNIENDIEELIGSHKLAISCVKYDQTNGVVVTGSWDTYVNIWDPRSQNRLVTQFSHNLKIYSMDLCGPNKFIVATDNQKVMLWDVRKNTEPIFTRNNNLKCIGGSISALPDGSGYAISSYEGRISINYVEDSLNKTNGFNFKCHRVSDSSTDIIYPVTFLKFLQYKNSRPYLMSAGGDGKVLCWNVKERRRIFNSTRYTSSISSVCVTHEPALIATAVGNLLPVGSDGLYTNEFDYNVCSKEKYWINVQPFDIKSVYKGLQN